MSFFHPTLHHLSNILDTSSKPEVYGRDKVTGETIRKKVYSTPVHPARPVRTRASWMFPSSPFLPDTKGFRVNRMSRQLPTTVNRWTEKTKETVMKESWLPIPGGFYNYGRFHRRNLQPESSLRVQKEMTPDQPRGLHVTRPILNLRED